MIIFINIDKIIFINTTVIDRSICYMRYNAYKYENFRYKSMMYSYYVEL
jgi:hypothetical protein